LCAMNVYVQRVNIAYNSYFFLSSWTNMQEKGEDVAEH
jgi:hypothetical protein